MEHLVPLVVAMIVDVGIATGDVTYIVTRCLILVAFGVAGLAFALTAQFFAAKAAVGASAELRRRLFEKLQSFSYTQIDDMGTATMITRMTSDVNQVQAGVNMTLRLLLRSPIVVLGATVMAFIVDWAAALVFVAVTPLLAAAVVGIMTATVPMYKKVQGEMDGVYLSTRENLAGVRVIRAFCKEADEEREFAQRNAQLRRRQKRAGRIAALTNPLTYALVSVAAIALVWVGGARVEGGVLLQGDVVALYSYLSIILVELVKFANLIFTASKAISCEKRIEAVLAKEGEPDVLHPARDGWSADAPAFSFEKLSGMDSYLSPEMKSTGEAIGYDDRLNRAMYKALQASGVKMKFYGTVVVTLADEDKNEALPLVRRFYDLGFNIEATIGTANFLKQHGIHTRVRGKLSEGSDEILQSIRAGYVSYIINTRAILSGVHYVDGAAIRQCAVQNGVTTFTSLDTVRIVLDVLEETIPDISTIDK